ncbi:MAG: hypothetical protein EOM20_01690 [Spartobacteria bacterium]|nr:hypothetical protein [Spartobacteria bacterium]
MNTKKYAKSAGVAIAILVMAGSGCILKRGVDFGHPAGAAERIPIIRIAADFDETPVMTGQEKILLLPVLGKNIDETLLNELTGAISEEMRKYVPAFVFEVDPEGPLSGYITLENLSPTTDLFDQQEVARLGMLLGASHVLCSKVRDARVYAPQLIRIDFVLIDVASASTVADMEGTFDAREQQVQMAMSEYLQRRRGRKYDKTNLDVMLYSPSEYVQFVSAECCRALADRLWSDKPVFK